ncbi:MAG: pyridoxal phosphate-dependent aminotransferase [Clostridiales bacterium]|nr:pyridoxal phosphate-dependent aminotransferase [Clostridiales bacterium]
MISNKLATVTPSFTIGISTKVKELKSKGINVTNLSIGEPDFLTPENIKEAAIKAIQNNMTKYDAAAGLLELRQAISKKLKADNHLEYTPSQIVVSSGAKHSITNTLMAILNPNDEVIVPAPYWVSYPEMVKLTGGIPIFIDTKKENSFKLQPTELENAITKKTKAIFITNPSNPTGIIYSKEELKPLVDICVKNNIYIISDEIYEKISFGSEFTSIASFSKEAYDLTITVNGLSKAASMTGWRIGYTASNEELAKAMGSIQGHLVSHPSTISQWAALEAMVNSEESTHEMVRIYKERKELIVEILKNIPQVSYIEPQGAFYFFIDISNLKDKLTYTDSLSLKVCDDLLEKHLVAFVPGIAFGNDDFIRMSYATSMENIEKGLQELKKYAESLY